MGITSKELAKLLNLSASAVSLALNNKPGVSTETRKRVLSAAEKYGLEMSRIAQKSDSILQGTVYFVIYKKHGAVVSDTPFFSQLTEGVNEVCRELSYYLGIQYVSEGDNIEKMLYEWSRIGCVGIILLGTEMQEADLKPFLDSPIPFVLLDNYFEEIQVDSVLINNVQGAYTATNYLVRKYSEQPGYLHSAYSINNFDEREDGFYKAVRKNGMSTSRSIVHLLTPSMEGAYADMKRLIQQGEALARCYFADNDLIAAGAIKAFQENGFSIPNDIAVIGFDNMPICTYIEPNMTTIHVPKQYMGGVAVRRLKSRLQEGDHIPVKIEISTNLQKRKSS